MWAAGFGLFVPGVILLIAAPISKRKNSRCSAQTQGTLVGDYETENSQGAVGHAYVYSYRVNGIEYRIKSTAYPKADGVGEPCTIWYDPEKPQVAQPFHSDTPKVFRALLLIGGGLVLLGLVLIGAGIAQQSR